jgi:hypothetical protein
MAPDLLPVLSRGRHRNPRKGACLMELASLLAGERFSDHPGCAHPVLAAVARSVNDCTTDAGRPALAPLAPAVIGTASDDPGLGPALVRLCCRRALERRDIRGRFVVSVGLLSAQHQLDRLDGRPPSSAEEVLRPLVAAREVRDADRFVRGVRASARYYRRRGAQEAAVCAVLALASEQGPATDDALRSLLVEAVALTRDRLAETADDTVPEPRPAHDGTGDGADRAGLGPDGRDDTAADAASGWDADEWARVCALVGTVPAPRGVDEE